MTKTPIVFITSNQRKVDYIKQWLDWPVQHHKLDLDELQSLDPHEVAEHKARQAYVLLQQPVLIDDTSLTFTAMGKLPGTYIRWFLEELGTEGLCRMAAAFPHQKAVATVTYAYFDGATVRFFEASVRGSVPPIARGTQGMGWDAAFVPDGALQTFAEMTDDEKKQYSARATALQQLQEFLTHE